MKSFVLFFTCLLLITACHTGRLKKLDGHYRPTPPGTVPVAPNLYVDASEIANIDYQEFLSWTKRSYGDTSKEYQMVFPDTMVWKTNNSLNANYFFYNWNYPVVGISYAQAKAYCKWRSNRVLEYILLHTKLLGKETLSPDSILTVERYFNPNSGYFLKQDSNFVEYPEYDLPDTSFYTWLMPRVDSINKHYPLPRRYHEWQKAFVPHCLDEESKEDSSYIIGERPYFQYKGIIHLLGNVRELCNNEGISFGGSYRDSCAVIRSKKFYKDSTVNNYTGFRCICRYKRWQPTTH